MIDEPVSVILQIIPIVSAVVLALLQRFGAFRIMIGICACVFVQQLIISTDIFTAFRIPMTLTICLFWIVRALLSNEITLESLKGYVHTHVQECWIVIFSFLNIVLGFISSKYCAIEYSLTNEKEVFITHLNNYKISPEMYLYLYTNLKLSTYYVLKVIGMLFLTISLKELLLQHEEKISRMSGQMVAASCLAVFLCSDFTYAFVDKISRLF